MIKLMFPVETMVALRGELNHHRELQPNDEVIFYVMTEEERGRVADDNRRSFLAIVVDGKVILIDEDYLRVVYRLT